MNLFFENEFVGLFKDNIKKFRAQAKKLEDSDALKDARDKYVSPNGFYQETKCFFMLQKTLERETMKSSTVIREKLGEIGEKVKEVTSKNLLLLYSIRFILE